MEAKVWIRAMVGVCLLVGASPEALRAQGAGGLKIAVIDVRKILTDSVSGRQVLATLDQLRGEKMQVLEGQRKELDDLRNRYQEARLTLAEDRIAEMEKEIEDRTIALRRLQDDAQRELQKRQQEDFTRIEAAVMPIIDALGQEYGYTLIFNKFEAGLVYADESVDITALVIERFNASTAAPGS